jgi:hypothetical protein
LILACFSSIFQPALVRHGLAEMLRFRMLAIACGYEDGDNCAQARAILGIDDDTDVLGITTQSHSPPEM